MKRKLETAFTRRKEEFVSRTSVVARRLESGPLGGLLLTRQTQIVIDLTIAATAFVLAHLLRFNGWPPHVEARRMLLILPYVVIGRVVANYLVGVYKRVWRYASIPDAVHLMIAAGIISLALLILRIALTEIEFYLTIPIGTILIDYLLVVCGMLGVRLFRRVTFEGATRGMRRPPGLRQRVLLAGAGDAGVMTVREVARRPDLGVQICGFVDDDRKKQKAVIHGVPVLGGTKDIPALAASKRVDQVVITMASAPRKTLRRILDICESANVPVKIIPGLYEILGGNVEVTNMRSVEIEDLLGRDTIDLEMWLQSTKEFFAGAKILVTGAGGSIGREVCQQLVLLEPAEIILFDKDENSIFEAEREMRAAIGARRIALRPVICDLRLEARLKKVFERHRPDVVFHAAAHKHVPLMEINLAEAVLNNIMGTMVLLEACAEFGVKRCVMVSTDKAVNPTSVMGATKRIAELMFQAQAERLKGSGQYSCVRFGNVLGSRGSVVPTFREQIKAGGPITITDENMIRYFMTIPEAAQLIIQAGAIGKKGEIFLLDMGEPVKVIDLAKDMIRLSGLTLGEDIDIKITGLRPGEKLREELLIAEEGAQATRYEKIFVAPPLHYDFEALDRQVQSLIEAANDGDEAAIIEMFFDMNIGFRPSTQDAIEKAMAAT
jgi:FlaA1/EpsC-like NDP-sugar epimerase